MERAACRLRVEKGTEKDVKQNVKIADDEGDMVILSRWGELSSRNRPIPHPYWDADPDDGAITARARSSVCAEAWSRVGE